MTSMKSADRISAIVLFVLGLVMLLGGLMMDRMESRNIHPASIPGLVPIGLGILLIICAALLYRASRGEAEDISIDWGRMDKLIWAGALCLVFSTILVGKLPFYLATFLFITAFTAKFSWESEASRTVKIRTMVFALSMGIVFSAAISILFRYAFLVRLP